MISTILGLFFRRIFSAKTIFWKITFESLTILLTIAVIYYASESFILKSNIENNESLSLFVFLLVGEITLVLPMSFAERLLAHFLEIRNQHFYQTLVGLRISPNKFVLSRATVDAIFPFLRVVIILAFSAVFLGFKLSIFSLVLFFLLQFFATLIFTMMALITTLLYLKFNKGIGFFYTAQSFAAILSGVYFPVSVFPNYVKNISVVLPQTHILQMARLLFQGQIIPLNISVTLLIWLLLLSGIWLVLDRSLISWLKRKTLFY